MIEPRRALQFLARRWPELAFVLAALGIFCWVSYDAVFLRSVTYDPGVDYWEHSAALRALMEHPLHPQNPHLVSPAPSSRFGPQFLIVALLARLLHLDALGAMSLASVLNIALFLAGIYYFFRIYFRHALAPLYGLLVMFFGWWRGFNYSNVYALNVFFAVASYPSTTALGLTLLGFALVVRWLRGEVARPRLMLAVIALWIAAVFIIHPLTAMASLCGAGLLALFEPGASWRMRFELLGTIAVGLLLSHFWPYFSPWEVVRGGRGATSGWAQDTFQQLNALEEAAPPAHRHLHFFYRLPGLRDCAGLGLLALVFLPYFLLKRERWFIGLGAIAMLVPFIGNAFVDLPLGHRFVLLALVFLHIGVVALLLRLTPGATPGLLTSARPWLRVMGALCVAAVLGVFTVHGVLGARAQLARFVPHRDSPLVANMKAIAHTAGPGSVVLANSLLSWPLPTFGPKVVLIRHDDPLVSDAAERTAIVNRFLNRASQKEREEIIAHYGVTHVLLEREANHGLLELLDRRAVHLETPRYRLFQLQPAPAQ